MVLRLTGLEHEEASWFVDANIHDIFYMIDCRILCTWVRFNNKALKV